jgi:hypothetical protein
MIQSLTVSLDEKREELSAFYRQFGNKLFNDSSDPGIAGGALPPDRVETWKTLMAARSADAQAIIEIKTCLVRLQELSQFRKEMERNLNEERARYRELLERVGQAFFESYSDEDAAVFGETYEKASTQHSVVSRLENKHDDLRRELDTAGFFGKMFVQFKMANLASNLRQHRVKLGRILSDGAESLVRNGTIRARIEEGRLDGSSSDLYSTVQSAAVKIEEYKNRSASLDGDVAAVKATLASWDAADSPQRRMEELRLAVKESDRRIDSLLALAARDYTDSFLDEDGVSLLGGAGDGHTFSDMGAYAHQLEQIAALRSAISLTRRKIDVLETSVKIESIDKSIAACERNIGDCEKKIVLLQDQIELMRRNIASSGEERRKLVAHREAVEKTVPPDFTT